MFAPTDHAKPKTESLISLFPFPIPLSLTPSQIHEALVRLDLQESKPKATDKQGWSWENESLMMNRLLAGVGEGNKESHP